jgi:hypothetical protein
VRDRHRQLIEAMQERRITRRNLSPEQEAELEPYDTAVDKADAALIALDRRQMRVEQACKEGSDEFRAAGVAELERIEAARLRAGRAAHTAKVARNREVRRIDRANREERSA